MGITDSKENLLAYVNDKVSIHKSILATLESARKRILQRHKVYHGGILKRKLVSRYNESIKVKGDIMTGYFANSERPTQRTKTHVVHKKRPVPICGTEVSYNTKFQFCASGVRGRSVECKRCQRVLVRQKS